MPVVSVVIVFHRDQEFLRPTIASILNQTFRDLELVLVDNGAGIDAKTLAPLGEDPRVRWVRLLRDEGIGVAFNAGIAMSSGEFVALTDHDDLSLPLRLERQVAALRSDPELGLVSALADRIDEQGRKLSGGVFTLREHREMLVYSPYAAPLINPLVAGRREVFLGFPFRRQFRFSSEFDFYARVVEKWGMAVLSEVLLHYRWHSRQTTQRFADEIEQGRCVINLITARRRCGRPEKLEEAASIIGTASTAECSRRISEQCLAEGFYLPAAYLARRSLALERSLGAAFKATGLVCRIWRKTPSDQRRCVAAMFFKGPVRAFRLHPAKYQGGAS